MVVMPGYERGKSSIPTVDKSISYRLSNTSLVLSPIPSFKSAKTFCLQIIKEIVAFRTANSFVTPKYTSYDGRTYYTESGLEISNLDEQTQTELESVRQASSQQLKISDQIQTGDLIRFYQADHLGKVDTESISYLNSLPILQRLSRKRKSVN